MELKDGIKQINQSVSQSSASDATLEGYMLELKDANGNLVDKQPVSKIESLVYNYLTTKRQSELAKVMSVQESLGGANDNVFIMFHRKSDNYPFIVNPDKWASYQNSGETATGVAVVAGERILVVAPTETTAYWSSAAVSAGGKTATDRLTVLGDFEGKANTASQITHAEASGASYAPGYCAQYSNGQGLTAGSWWLPSLGELMMIYANMRKINYALSLISGATQLAETRYWSSTEHSAPRAWNLNLISGDIDNNTKTSNSGRVRPVSSISLNLPSFYKDYPDIASLSSAISLQPVLAGGNDNVFIMFHRKSDDYPLMFKPDKWTAQQNAGEVADGVVVVEGGHVLVVAPTESATKLQWGSADVAGGGVTTSSSETAYSDFAGKANTASQITHTEMSGEGYAPGFCHAYSRVNANGKGLTAGKWWLPSLGELMMIYANMRKINYALSLIEGATQLVEDAYWTSTESSVPNAWYLNLYGFIFGTSKAAGVYRVRPVSEFIK